MCCKITRPTDPNKRATKENWNRVVLTHILDAIALGSAIYIFQYLPYKSQQIPIAPDAIGMDGQDLTMKIRSKIDGKKKKKQINVRDLGVLHGTIAFSNLT